MANRKTPEERLADLQKQEAQLKARMDREKAKIRQAKRKDDTRRKIIAGALALEHQDADFQATMQRLIAQHVTRPHDRALFNLAPLPDKEDA